MVKVFQKFRNYNQLLLAIGGILALLFSIYSTPLVSQNPKIDSLKGLLETDLTPKEEVGVLLELTYDLSRLDNQRAEEYGKRAIKLAKENKLTDDEMSGKHTLGVVYKNAGKYKEALELFDQYLSYVTEKKDSLRIGATYSQLASINKNLGNRQKALQYYLDALPLYEAAGKKNAVGYTYSGIGLIYSDLKQYESALEQQLKALEISRSLGNPVAISIDLSNVGNVYFYQKDFEKAIEYYRQSLELNQKHQDQWGLAYDYHNIGATQFEMGNYEEALKSHLKGLDIRKSLGVVPDIAATHLELGQVYTKLGKATQAQYHLEEGLRLSEEIGSREMMSQGHELLAKTHKAFGNYKEAYDHLVQSVNLKDSLFDAKTTEEMANMLSLYEAGQKEAEIIRLQNEKLKSDARQRNLMFSILGIFLALLALGFVFWYRNRYRQQQKNADFEKERAEKLAKLDRLKDEFLARTSHELRTPLNGIIGIAESLTLGVAGKLPGRAVDNLTMVISSGKRLASLVNDLLDFSALKTREISLQKRPVDLYAATDVVLTLSQPFIRDKPIKLINRLPRNIPLVMADENRVQQILHNLVGNAVKFTDTGSIIVSGEEKESELHIHVTDTGIGIPPDKFETIFNVFEQLDGSDVREYHGTGLGLSITKQLVEIQGGRIWVESKVGEGSTFTFTLPLSDEQRTSTDVETARPKEIIRTAVATEENEIPAESPTLLAGQEEQIKILIVDDETVNRQVLENHLTLAGFAVTHASSGPEALEIMGRGETFDLIILDIMMPRMSGYEVCHKLRDLYLPSELPVVMLTAKNTVTDLVEGFKVGANDYLIKPFSRDELLSRIKTHLNLHRIFRVTGKFVPYEFIRAVGREAITDIRLGDHTQKDVTVFFSDIRNYTSMSEKMTPEENFSFVNSYVGKMGPVILKNKGFVNQYLGDGIMAIFPERGDYALKAGIEMQRAIAEYNEERKSRGRNPITVGMGFHTGPLVMGIIGDANRTDPATIADTVNAASRMEGLTKYYGANILFSEVSLNRIENREQFNFRYLGRVQVKGKEKVMGAYECFDGDPPEVAEGKLATLSIFKQGLQEYFSKNFSEAMASFEWILKTNPEDRVTRHFCKKAARYLEEGVPEGWTGIERLDRK